MSADHTALDTLDSGRRTLYLSGGLSGLVLGTGYLVILPLYAQVGAPPLGSRVFVVYAIGTAMAARAVMRQSGP